MLDARGHPVPESLPVEGLAQKGRQLGPLPDGLPAAHGPFPFPITLPPSGLRSAMRVRACAGLFPGASEPDRQRLHEGTAPRSRAGIGRKDAAQAPGSSRGERCLADEPQFSMDRPVAQAQALPFGRPSIDFVIG